MKLSRRVLSLFISASFVFSTSALSVNSVFAAVDENGCYVPDSSVETNRYYFAMPDDWYNENTDTAGIYWWSGGDACGTEEGNVNWPGYKAQKSNFDNVYYVDCPKDVPIIIWNNYIDGGTDPEASIYKDAKQIVDSNVEFMCAFDLDGEVYTDKWLAEMEESYNGDKKALGGYADNFFYDEEYGLGFSFELDNMIYVIDPERTGESFNGKLTYEGNWYFYFGNGDYGTYPTKEASESAGTLKNVADIDSIPTGPEITDDPTTPVNPGGGEYKINFDVKKSGWNLVKSVYCHIWSTDGSPTSSGEDWPAWQTKTELCTYNAETGIATFDLSKTGHEFSKDDGKVYYVIFSSNTGIETYYTVMSGSCIGDTMYCNGQLIENPQDSAKKSNVAVWENNPDCGPAKMVTSTGNIIGTVLPDGVTDVDLVTEYVLNYWSDRYKMDLLGKIMNQLNLNPYSVIDDIRQNTSNISIIGSVEESISTAFVKADVDLDGIISIKDATAIQKYLVGLADFTEAQKYAADVTGDRRISITDATSIQKLLVS